VEHFSSFASTRPHESPSNSRYVPRETQRMNLGKAREVFHVEHPSHCTKIWH
jgi:hypothetical protein